MSEGQGPDRAALERRLVDDPADVEARRAYAELLLKAGDYAAAQKQLELLQRQGGSAPPATSGPSAQLARPALRMVAGTAELEPAEVVELDARRSTRFVDVVGMEELKKSIRLRIVEPFLRPSLFQRFAKKTGGGILLYGPPGCGKTLIARAIAGECNASFLSVGISDVLNLWVGESERNLARLFEKARAERPSVMFFDELDALAFSRSKSTSEHTRHLVDEFLHQLDGMSGDNEQVLVLAATNMPWDVDGAMKRPGRFDRSIFVPPPDEAARAAMIERKLQSAPVQGVDAAALAKRTLHFSGADVDGLIEAAKERVLGEIVDGGAERPLRHEDFLAALEGMHPTTLDWLKTARNLVKFGGADAGYKDVETWLKAHRMT